MFEAYQALGRFEAYVQRRLDNFAAHFPGEPTAWPLKAWRAAGAALAAFDMLVVAHSLKIGAVDAARIVRGELRRRSGKVEP
jgi:hypothetical protein